MQKPKSHTTKPTFDVLTEWLSETIEHAKEDADENHGDPNSYGNGYDQGYVAALMSVRDFLNGDVDA